MIDPIDNFRLPVSEAFSRKKDIEGIKFLKTTVLLLP